MEEGPEGAGPSISIQNDPVPVTEEPRPTDCNDFTTIPEFIDTVDLSARVRNYLQANSINWGRFSKLVLGMTQGRLSVLLSSHQVRPWEQLTTRARSIYARMDFWMKNRHLGLRI